MNELGRRYTLFDRLVPPWRGSMVAAINARFRARESERIGPRLLEDPYALHLGGSHPALRILELAERIFPGVRRMGEAQITAHCVRHATIDTLVRQAVTDGFEQVVIVGAGYDMRSARIGGARWFEVDRAAVVRAKLRALSTPDAVVRVAADVETEDPMEGLVAGGLDPRAPTCFVLEGLIHYLPDARVRVLLARVASSAEGRRRVVLSWIEPAMSRRVTSTFREVVRVLGEVPRTFYTGGDLDLIFRASGQEFASYSYLEQVERFAPAARGRVVGLTQEVGVAG